jgi:hypothetical protein
MTGALIQLVAYGIDNLYLTHDPQITYFKVVYRRHTNFTSEHIPQPFINQPNFGKKSTCILAKNADLIGKSYIVVTLPKVQTVGNTQAKFAWVKKIGFAIIKTIEIEINGKIIDTHYGEWLNLWAELTGELTNGKSRGFKKLIGDVDELTNYTDTKDEYILRIPLQFWFCKSSTNAIPIISLQYCDIKINVEFQDALNCYYLSPSHYIKCRDDIVNFIPNEYIEQNINGVIASGIFMYYDTNYKRLYYQKITNEKLISIPVSNDFDTSQNNITTINSLLLSPQGLKYSIVGKTSGYSTYAEFNNKTITQTNSSIRNIDLVNAYLLVTYYYIDEDERYKFTQSKHDYLIEQLFFTPNIPIDNINFSGQIIVNQPCKFMVWIAQMNYIYNSLDYYNYTDTYDKNNEKSLITEQTITLNGNQRIKMRDSTYFDTIQKHIHTKTTTSTGINMYSFALYPFIIQPSGTCNMSQFDDVKIQLKLSSTVNINNNANFRAYCLCSNIFRISNGYAGMVFVK